MKKSQLSLKWLEVFQLMARTGSAQITAQEAGLSVSTVSHHLARLESSLDTALFDHSCRPMRITPTGARFLHHIDEALRLIRKAEHEATSGNLSQTRSLSLALIEDFDSEIAPELARALTATMPDCTFRHLTRPSHDILTLLRQQEIDIGVASRPQFDQPDLIELPLLRDPFVLAVPARHDIPAQTYIDGSSGLPLLRYSQAQIMGPQIETQLKRLQITLPNRFEFESNQTLMSMIAEGGGWAITTPTNYMRAGRFHRQVNLIPFPGKGFARYLSVFTTDLHAGPLTQAITGTLRHLIQQRAILPATDRHPWLRGLFDLAAPRQEVSQTP